MVNLLGFLLLLLLTDGVCNAAVHIRPRQAPPKSTPVSSLKSGPNDSATATLAQTHNSSQITSRAPASSHYTQSLNVTALPAPFRDDQLIDSDIQMKKIIKNFDDVKSGFCDLTDNFCSFKDDNGTFRKANPTSMDDQCLLWDASCSGNKTLAMDKFFKTAYAGADEIPDRSIFSNDCFARWKNAGGDPVSQLDCDTYNPPERLAEWQKMKDWMRTPQCVSAAGEWQNMTGNHWDVDRLSSGYDPTEDTLSPSCCGKCSVQAQNVDLYYWPEPDTDLSCQSIIGESVRPLDYGATTITTTNLWDSFTNITQTYWACNITGATGPSALASGLTWAYTTASITTIGDLSVKLPLLSPWSSSPCDEDNNESQGSNSSSQTRNGHTSILARDHSSTTPSSITQRHNVSVSTIVSEGFTFTSPSVYAKFHGLGLTDGCGRYTIKSLMLSFSAGELSSLEGNLGMVPDRPGPTSTLTAKPFNFRDLPCPPQSVMEANWYKPELGEPYRPLVAWPSKLRQMGGELEFCVGDFFTAYDPPYALKTEAALLPPVSAGDPNSAQVPSPTQDPGAGATVASIESTLKPAIVPTVDQPKATITSTPIPDDKRPSPDLPSGDPAAHFTSPSKSTPDPGNPKPGSSSDDDGDPNHSSNSNHGSDPSQDGNHDQDGNAEHESDPNQGNGLGQGSDTRIDSHLTQGGDASKDSDLYGASTIKENPDQGADPITVVSNNAKQPDKASPTAEKPGKSVPQVDASDDPAFNILVEGKPTTINNQRVEPLSHEISVAGTTLTPGDPPITISGTPLAYGSSFLAIGISIVSLAPKSQKPTTTKINGQTFTMKQNAVVIAGTTLTPGAPPITLSGTPIAYKSSVLVVGSSTLSLASNDAKQTTTDIDGQIVTIGHDSVIVAGTTLTAGAPPIALPGTGTLITPESPVLVVGSSTITFTKNSKPTTTSIDGQAFTIANNAVAVAGTTLTPGVAAITVSGVPIFIDLPAPVTTMGSTLVSMNNAGQLLFGSRTIALAAETTGIGGLILGGFGDEGPFDRGPASDSSRGNANSSSITGTDRIEIFRDEAEGLRSGIGWKVVVSMMMTTGVVIFATKSL